MTIPIIGFCTRRAHTNNILIIDERVKTKHSIRVIHSTYLQSHTLCVHIYFGQIPFEMARGHVICTLFTFVFWIRDNYWHFVVFISSSSGHPDIWIISDTIVREYNITFYTLIYNIKLVLNLDYTLWVLCSYRISCTPYRFSMRKIKIIFIRIETDLVFRLWSAPVVVYW